MDTKSQLEKKLMSLLNWPDLKQSDAESTISNSISDIKDFITNDVLNKVREEAENFVNDQNELIQRIGIKNLNKIYDNYLKTGEDSAITTDRLKEQLAESSEKHSKNVELIKESMNDQDKALDLLFDLRAQLSTTKDVEQQIRIFQNFISVSQKRIESSKRSQAIIKKIEEDTKNEGRFLQELANSGQKKIPEGEVQLVRDSTGSIRVYGKDNTIKKSFRELLPYAKELSSNNFNISQLAYNVRLNDKTLNGILQKAVQTLGKIYELTDKQMHSNTTRKKLKEQAIIILNNQLNLLQNSDKIKTTVRLPLFGEQSRSVQKGFLAEAVYSMSMALDETPQEIINDAEGLAVGIVKTIQTGDATVRTQTTATFTVEGVEIEGNNLTSELVEIPVLKSLKTNQVYDKVDTTLKGYITKKESDDSSLEGDSFYIAFSNKAKNFYTMTHNAIIGSINPQNIEKMSLSNFLNSRDLFGENSLSTDAIRLAMVKNALSGSNDSEITNKIKQIIALNFHKMAFNASNFIKNIPEFFGEGAEGTQKNTLFVFQSGAAFSPVSEILSNIFNKINKFTEQQNNIVDITISMNPINTSAIINQSYKLAKQNNSPAWQYALAQIDSAIQIGVSFNMLEIFNIYNM